MACRVFPPMLSRFIARGTLHCRTTRGKLKMQYRTLRVSVIPPGCVLSLCLKLNLKMHCAIQPFVRTTFPLTAAVLSSAWIHFPPEFPSRPRKIYVGALKTCTALTGGSCTHTWLCTVHWNLINQHLESVPTT